MLTLIPMKNEKEEEFITDLMDLIQENSINSKEVYKYKNTKGKSHYHIIIKNKLIVTLKLKKCNGVCKICVISTEGAKYIKKTHICLG
jgi:hypothetical protein